MRARRSKKIAPLKENARVEWLRKLRWLAGSQDILRQGLGAVLKAGQQAVAVPMDQVECKPAQGNSTSHGSLGIVPGGEKVRYLKTSKGWSQVMSSKGTGWIKNSYLTAKEIKQYPVAVYGTLRKGQKAYYMVKGRTTSEVKTKIVSHDLFLRRDLTWLSYMVPAKNPGSRVVAERMTLKRGSYASTIAALDRYERFDPSRPMATRATTANWSRTNRETRYGPMSGPPR